MLVLKRIGIYPEWKECKWTSYVYYQNLVFLSYLDTSIIILSEGQGSFPRAPAAGFGLSPDEVALHYLLNPSPVFLNLLKRLHGASVPRCPDCVLSCSDRAVYFACYSKAKEQFNGVSYKQQHRAHILSWFCRCVTPVSAACLSS